MSDKYEELILDMFSRIKQLEKEVSELKSKVEKNTEAEVTKEKMTRKKAREHVMEMLRQKNPKMSDFEVASRENGSGIVYEFKDKINPSMSYPMYIKFFFSKMKSENRDYSWFTVKREDIEEMRAIANSEKECSHNIEDIIFFAFDEDSEEELLVMLSRIELLSFIKYKNFDSNDVYHFYFKKKDDGKIIEFKDNKEIDVTNISNDYSSLTQIHLERKTSWLNEEMDKETKQFIYKFPKR